MAKTFAQIKSEVKSRLSIENSNHVSDSELSDMVQDSINYVSNILIKSNQFWNVKEYSFTISSGNSATLPFDYYKTLKLDYLPNSSNDKYTLDLINIRDEALYSSYDSNYGYYHSEVTPTKYFIKGSSDDGYASVTIYPNSVSSGNYNLWYYANQPIYSDSDEVVLGPPNSPWRELIVIHSMVKIATKDEDGDMLNMLLPQFQFTLDRVINEAADRELSANEPFIATSWWDNC